MSRRANVFNHLALLFLLLPLCAVAEAQLLKLDNKLIVENGIDGDVILGQTFFSGTSSDTHLLIRDPGFISSADENTLEFQAAIARLLLGSGNDVEMGRSGSLALKNARGHLGAYISGEGELIVGGPFSNGTVSVLDPSGEARLTIEGTTGTIENAPFGNGLVKAWCELTADGSIGNSFQCDSDPNETGKVGDGRYQVNFTGPAQDVSYRPFIVSCSSTSHSDPPTCVSARGSRESGVSGSRVFIETFDSDGLHEDSAFTVVVF